MTTPLQLTKGEASVGKLITRNGIVFADNTLQTTAAVFDFPPTRFAPTFTATGLTYTGSGATHPTYDSFYVKVGGLVSFNIKVSLTTVTNFGTGQFKTQLPFTPITAAINHFPAWCWVNPALPADDLNGHIILQADHLPADKVLDMHWLKAATSNPKPVIESLFEQGTPVTMTTASVIYINGTYITAE